MASSIAPAVPSDGSVDVGVNGPPAWVVGVAPVETAPPRLQLVCALLKTDQIPKAAASKQFTLLTSVRIINN